MTARTQVTVREVRPEDHEEWVLLYRGYRDFYLQPHNEDAIATVWAWLGDPKHETRGLVAERAGKLVGLAHFRTFARPLAASHGLFLDDLFTEPTARGCGGSNGTSQATLSHCSRRTGNSDALDNRSRQRHREEPVRHSGNSHQVGHI